LASIPDPMFRQTTRDFCLNQQFRKDYWVKGCRTLTALEQAEALRGQRILLAQPRADVGLKVTGSLGEATLQEAVYGPILDQLADHKPKTLGQLEQALNRPLKKWASNASGTLFSKKRVAQTRLRSDCTGQSGLFAGHLAHFGRTYPRAHA